MVCVCRPLSPPSLPLHHHHLLSLGGSMFISRHDMRLAYTYCDPRVQFLIGYDPCELLGRTVYQFHNPVDAHKCSECHSTLLKTGRGVSRYYRYLGRSGVWVWMQTTATLLTDTQGRPQYVVCNNYIISQKEGERSHQMELQQQQQQQNHQPLTRQGVVAGDLSAKGALDLPGLALTQATSPVSVTDSEQDPQEDTGYSSAVSSVVSSAHTSPCPLAGGVAAAALDLDLCLLPGHKQLGGGGGGEEEGALLLPHHHPPPRAEVMQDRDREGEEGEEDLVDASLVPGLESTAELGFHSTLSSAIYGEGVDVQDLAHVPELAGVQDLPSSLESLAGASAGCGGDGGRDLGVEDAFPLSCLSPRPGQSADPFLCEAGGSGGGRGRGEGSLSHVMEDMEVLDTLLQDIGRQCDSSSSSHDAVFPPASPLPPASSPHHAHTSQGQGEAGEAVAPACGKSGDSLILDGLAVEAEQPRCKRTGAVRGLREPAVVTTGGLEAMKPPSLLRTLLDQEGKGVKTCPPVTHTWTSPFSASSGKKSAGSVLPSQKGQAGTASRTPSSFSAVASKAREGSHAGGGRKKQQQQQPCLSGSGLGSGSPQQVMVCGDRHVLVPRKVDLTEEDSDDEVEEEGEGGEGLSAFSEDVYMQSVLPEELMDFAMQYCDPGTDSRDSMETDLLAQVEADVWGSMDHLMTPDTPTPTPTPSPTHTPTPSPSPHHTALMDPQEEAGSPCSPELTAEEEEEDPQKGHSSHKGEEEEELSGVCEPPELGKSGKTQTPPSPHPPAPSSCVNAAAAEKGHVIQSDVVSSTRQDPKPTITIIRAGGGRGQPLSKEKMAAILKLVALSPPAHPKAYSLVSPALSDHKYSSTRTLSPSPAPASTPTPTPTSLSFPLPAGKRMRTHWDKRDTSGQKRGSETSELSYNLSADSSSSSSSSSPSPPVSSRLSDPSCKGQTAGCAPTPAPRQQQGLSPRRASSTGTSSMGTSSTGSPPLHKLSGPGSSKPSSQPTSPTPTLTPTPIPVNGGGKPLTAMSELEKHLRGLVAPPDERKKDSDSDGLLLPLEESSKPGGGSKPFLELLLTGEISHERYRQIDYHLLYQERERRLEENGHSS